MKIFLSKRAESSLLELDKYLLDNWSEKVRDKFFKTLDLRIKQIASFPQSCPESAIMPGVYKSVVTKQISLYYRVNIDQVEVIAIIDSRQNPNNVNLESS